MRLDEVTEAGGSHRKRRRVGRGPGSGRGKTCGRGHKGVGARAGGGPRVGREGGQTELALRFPKRGFKNVNFARRYQIVNLSALSAFESGSTVDPQVLADRGLLRSAGDPVKVLGDGALDRGLTVCAHKFSKSAAEKIAAAGGTVRVLEQ